MDIKELDILGDDIAQHWYYIAKSDAILDFLPQTYRNVADIGAGSGYFSRVILEHGACSGRAICVDINYKQERDETVAGRRMAFRTSLTPDEAKECDLALFMDVIEHVEDDVGLLSSYVERLSPGATVLITVPAFQHLWSDHDVFLEHYRRYSKKQLNEVVKKSGLVVEKTRFYFGLIYPLVTTIRLLSRLAAGGQENSIRSNLRRHHPMVNTILVALHDMERRLIFPWNSIAGVSLFCLARKTQ